MAQVDEVAPGIYRICGRPAGKSPVSYNQFLIDDEHPALIHTGPFPVYEVVRHSVAEVLDPARLEYIIVPHFESDECGGMSRFVSDARDAVLVCSEVGARINLSQWDYSGPVHGARDGHTIDLGKHELRFLETPHVHHWDSMMVYDETTRSLFPADLFIQPGNQPAIVHEDLSAEMCHLYREIGIFAAEEPVRRVVNRIATLGVEWLHPMHGGSLPRDAMPPYIDALRTEPFAFEGKLFGRRLPE